MSPIARGKLAGFWMMKTVRLASIASKRPRRQLRPMVIAELGKAKELRQCGVGFDLINRRRHAMRGIVSPVVEDLQGRLKGSSECVS